MKAKLLAVATLLASVAAGTYFVTWDAPPSEVDGLPLSFGNFEVVDRNNCSVAACGTAQCDSARAILADAGSPCTLRLVECGMRFGAHARRKAADAGVVFSVAKYQQVRLVAMRCATTDGGFALGIATDSNGWPVHAVVSVAHPCALKPDPAAACTWADGGVIEERNSAGGWDPNTKLPGQFAGAGCQRSPCAIVSGDPP